MSDLIWTICPVKRMYGEGMVETTVAIDSDRTFTLTCHVDYVEDKNNVKHYSKPLYSVKELEN